MGIYVMDAQGVSFSVTWPLLGVGAFSLLLSFCFCCYLWRLKRNALTEDRGYVTRKFKTNSKNQTNEVCPVCLEDFKLRESIAVCTCHHGFHSKCLTQWLEQKNICPLCKARVQNLARETTGLIRPSTSSNV